MHFTLGQTKLKISMTNLWLGFQIRMSPFEYNQCKELICNWCDHKDHKNLFMNSCEININRIFLIRLKRFAHIHEIYYFSNAQINLIFQLSNFWTWQDYTERHCLCLWISNELVQLHWEVYKVSGQFADTTACSWTTGRWDNMQISHRQYFKDRKYNVTHVQSDTQLNLFTNHNLSHPRVVQSQVVLGTSCPKAIQ